jgi:hypothetical protein
VDSDDKIEIIDLTEFKTERAKRWRDDEVRETIIQARFDRLNQEAVKREKRSARVWTLAILFLCGFAIMGMVLRWLP